MTIDKRHTYGIMIDTETCNTMDDPFCYDIGFQVIDSKGRLYEEHSFVIREVFYGMQELMQTAYYAEKIPQYVEDIQNGKRILTSLFHVKQVLREVSERYDCKFISAHNARFDYKSLNTTQRYLTSSKYRYLTPYGLEWWDTMKMAQDVICKMPTYKAFCEANGYKCKNGQLRKTAEILYRFITKDNDFQEEHKGLDDVDIERQILAYCVRQHKKMNRKLWG